ncbi:hypothetical protein K239x_26730 [Planctomycetes bacterium K23_9]|uniref:Uncharacterized protein n=2 Tax=Stieleria marina TaxID=1930275 RepID=A0A517NUB4_9BACT|nr:hypothetical protein K239x_26730 [Planctomycetes bacterium K23_9]
MSVMTLKDEIDERLAAIRYAHEKAKTLTKELGETVRWRECLPLSFVKTVVVVNSNGDEVPRSQSSNGDSIADIKKQMERRAKIITAAKKIADECDLNID